MLSSYRALDLFHQSSPMNYHRVPPSLQTLILRVKILTALQKKFPPKRPLTPPKHGLEAASESLPPSLLFIPHAR